MYAMLSVILLSVLSVHFSNQASVISMFDSSDENGIELELDFDEGSIENSMEIDPLLFQPVDPTIEEDARLNTVQFI